MLRHLKCIIKDSGRRSYTFAVGKPNVPKLANFPDIDIFVHVACPLSSIIDSTDYYRDVVTAVEADIALNPFVYIERFSFGGRPLIRSLAGRGR